MVYEKLKLTDFQKFTEVVSDLEKYYEKNFATDQEDFEENKKIKHRIMSIIIDAHSVDNKDMVKKGLDLLRESTGCAEDYEIFLEIVESLHKLNIINSDAIKDILDNTPSSRF